MRGSLLPSLVLAAAVAGTATAQDAQEDRDRGFLVGLIEDNLAAPGLSVRLDGFEGALSSTASLERLTVSDDEGTWLVLEDVVLDWNRSALLRGRLVVEELSADLIRLERTPLPPEGVEALPDAGASGFSLPNLPVSVDIGLIRAQRIELGEPLLGQAVALSLEASAELADGSGQATIEAQRLDGPEGTFSIAAAYAAGDQDLTIDIDLSEAQGGIAATLLQLPGAPAIDLTVAGTGPLDDFAADIAIASDGQERIAGAVTLAGTEAGRRFDVDLGGDVTALFAPQYRPFFGDDIRLEATGTSLEAGGTDLERLRLDTQALTLDGTVRLGPDGWPIFVDVDGNVASADGAPVVLPTGDAATVGRASLSISLDAATSDDFTLTAEIEGYDGEAAALASGDIDVTGRLTRSGNTVEAAEAALRIVADGLDLSDPDLSGAVGEAIALTGDITWSDGTPIRITGLDLDGTGYDLQGDVAFTATPSGLEIAPDLAARFDDLSRLSGVAGRDLGGAVAVDVSGALNQIAGTFDLAVQGTGDGLAVGIDQVDPLLDGTTDLVVRARRTVDGTFLDALDLNNPQLTLTAEAALVDEDALEAGQTGRAVLDARIADGRPLDPRLDGPVTLNADLDQNAGGVWSGAVAATAPQGIALSAEGALTGAAPDVTFDATVPDLSAFVENVPGGVTLSGRAFARNEVWSLDAEATGPWDVTASVSGPVTGKAANIAFEARLPDLSDPVPGIAAIETLAGPVALDGTIARDGEVWVLDTGIAAPTGITATAAGAVTGPQAALAIDARIPEIEAVVPATLPEALRGEVALDGTVGLGDAVRVDLALSAPAGVRASVEGPVTGPDAEIAVAARVPEIEALVPADLPEALRGAVALDGTVGLGEAVRVDLAVDAPAGITARARGPVTGGAARLDVAATVPELDDLVPAVEGTLSLDATLAQQGEDWIADVTANGPAGTRMTVDTVVTASPLAVAFTATAPDLSALVPAVPGALDVSGEARQIETGWEVDVAGTGPYAAMFDASGALSDGAISAQATGRIPDASALAPQLSGALDFDAAAAQIDGQWRVDADVAGAQGLAISVDGIATGPEADISFEASAANVAPFAPGLNGPLDASGRLFQRGGEWAVDVDASGPLGATLRADGTLTGDAPNADFDVSVPNIAPLLPDFPGPLGVSGTATRRGEAWAIDIDANGPSGTQAAVVGTVAGGGSLDLSVDGTAPLGLANTALAPRRLSGTAQFDLSVNGPPSLGSVSGTISTADAAISLPTLRNGFEDIDATATLSGGRAQIDLSAAPQTGGQVTISGPVDLAAPFDAQLAIGVNATLADPNLYTTRITGDVAVNGPLTGGALISGGLTIGETEISVPSSGLTAIGALPPITHVGESRPVRRTLARAGQLDENGNGTGEGGGGAVYDLNLSVSAPGRIFVRGRGLDAELGGRLTIRGTTANPITAGGFELVRGRLDLLDQRFDLDEGSITFQGGLVPNLRLVANTQTDDIQASIIIEGPADDIEVRFESSPDLPEEEILAQIFFGRDLSSLSAFQALQLANSIAVLAGRGSGGVLNGIRSSAGLDDLDVTTNEDGTVGVRAGRYLTENLYTDVQVDQKGGAEVSLNLDIRPGFTVRATADDDTETSLGIFFERDY
ncbi:MAG: translocation/assembly module TamB domain-containing protein [Pseudomonadota bacterium]